MSDHWLFKRFGPKQLYDRSMIEGDTQGDPRENEDIELKSKRLHASPFTIRASKIDNPKTAQRVRDQGRSSDN